MHVTTADFIKNYGRLADVALGEPVTITKNGHDRLVVISASEYERLKRGDQQEIPASKLSGADFEEMRKTMLVSSPPPMSGEERARKFVEWANSHRDTPLLSDEAISRASLNPDRW